MSECLSIKTMLQTPGSDPATHGARVVQEISAPREGVGNAGCPVHPQPRVRNGSKNAHEYSQRVHRNRPASPRNGLRLIPRSPWRPGFLATIAGGLIRRLDTSVGVSGPHGFAVRKPSALVSRAARVHRIQPRVRDDRDTPQVGWMAADIQLIWGFGKPEYFFGRDWTAQITLIRFRKLDFARKCAGASAGLAAGSSGSTRCAWGGIRDMMFAKARQVN
jgi:hypothetical protein